MTFTKFLGRALLVWASLRPEGAVPMQFTQAAAAVEPQTVQEEEPLRFWEFAELVLDQRDEQGVRGVDKERSRYACHVEGTKLAQKYITEISSRDIREWLRDMQQKRALKRGHSHELTDKPLGRETIKRAQCVINAVFAEAVEQELVDTNPSLGVKAKKIATEADTEERWSYLTRDEQKAIVAADIPLDEKLAIRFAIGTGLRHGEQFNVEIPDLIVDGNDPRVIVRYSNMHRGRKQPPKNGKLREVALEGDALVASREWLAYLPTFAPVNPHNLVFPTMRGCRRNQGKPLGRNRSIHDVFRAAGIAARKGLRWHSLRHTFATNLLTGGPDNEPVRLAVIQRLMGHSSSAVTERYAQIGAAAVKNEYRDAFAKGVVGVKAKFVNGICTACKNTGVIETGNNDEPCECPAGDTAVFNVCIPGGGVRQITGKEMKARCA